MMSIHLSKLWIIPDDLLHNYTLKHFSGLGQGIGGYPLLGSSCWVWYGYIGHRAKDIQFSLEIWADDFFGRWDGLVVGGCGICEVTHQRLLRPAAAKFILCSTMFLSLVLFPF